MEKLDLRGYEGGLVERGRGMHMRARMIHAIPWLNRQTQEEVLCKLNTTLVVRIRSIRFNNDGSSRFKFTPNIALYFMT